MTSSKPWSPRSFAKLSVKDPPDLHFRAGDEARAAGGKFKLDVHGNLLKIGGPPRDRTSLQGFGGPADHWIAALIG